VLEDKFFEIVKERIDPFLRGVLGTSVEQFLEKGGDFRYYFQPITGIHLHSHLDFELEPNGDIAYVYIFSIIALGILLIACINFVNLSTARSTMRAREVGIRKTVGSDRRQIVRQFLTETVAMTLLAVVLAGVMAYAVLPLFNRLAGKQLVLPFFTQWWGIPLFIGFAVFVGLTAGMYPALFLASFNPAVVLKGNTMQSRQRSVLRTLLVVLQFTISVVLIISTLTVQRQMGFIQNRNMGFKKENVIVIHKTDDLGRSIGPFKDALLRDPRILQCSNSVDLPGNPVEVAALTPEGQTEEQAKIICYMAADEDFLQTYGIVLKEGRFFYESRAADDFGLVLNETAVRAMDLEEPVGMLMINSLFNDQRYPVIGVVEDFHYQGLHQRIQPMFFMPMQENQVGRYLSVRFRSGNTADVLRVLESTWDSFAGGQAFEYEFFDDHFARVYLAEERTGRIFLTFSVLAIIIACLGLFGLSAFITERRTKEIGVRKVLGSSMAGVTVLLVGQFVKWVLIANLIAWPIAYLAMRRWLQNFAYHANLGLEIFFLSAITGLVIAVLTVSYQVIKVAVTNPVKSLRYE
jgi:putative ABC transport system permease protein